MDKKHIEKESFPNNLKIEEIDSRTKGSTIDAFQPFQNYMKDQEEKKGLNEAFSFGARSPSRNPKLTWIKVRKINPNIARNLALFGKPFAGRNISVSPKKTQKISSSLMKSLIPEWNNH